MVKKNLLFLIIFSFNKALEINESNFLALNNKGVALNYLGKHNEAL